MPRSTACCAITSFPRARSGGRGLRRAVFNPRQSEGGPTLPARALPRWVAARVRVPDRHRSVPADREPLTSPSRTPSTPRSCPSTRMTRSRLFAGRSVPAIRRSSRQSMPPARTSSWRWSSPRSSAARSISTASSSQGTASRCCSKSPRGTASSPATAPILGATVIAEGEEYQAFRWVNPDNGEGGVLRQGRPVVEALLPQVAASIRAARHLGVLTQPAAPSGSHAPSAPGCRLRRQSRRAGRSGCERHRRLRRLGGRRRQADPSSASGRVRDLLSAPLVVRQGDASRSERVTRAN